jgi:hypothetical protein
MPEPKRPEQTSDAKPRKKGPTATPFRDRTIPKVARRLGVKEHQLRRAKIHGDVQTRTWCGLEWIEPAEEARLSALLSEVRAPIPEGEAGRKSDDAA